MFLLLFCLIIQAQDSSEVVGAKPDPVNYASLQVGNDCKELSMGESIVINRDYSQSPTGIEQKYKLTRDGKNKNLYTAEFNLQFFNTPVARLEKYGSPFNVKQAVRQLKNGEKVTYNNNPSAYPAPSDLDENGSAVGTQNGEMQAIMMVKVQSCFKQYDGKLKSPDGTTLNLRLLDANNKKGVPLVEVDVQSYRGRSYSRSYESDIDCPTVIHEAMHLMGLCDGYKETAQDKPAYDCRSIEPDDSIMSDQWFTLEDKYRVIVCRTNGSSKVKPPYTEIAREGCPLGPNRVSTDLVFPEIQKSVLEEWQKMYKGQYDFYFLKNTAPANNWNIYPAQMRQMIKPNCLSENKKYSTCSQNAYKSSSAEYKCNIPEYCKTGEHLL